MGPSPVAEAALDIACTVMSIADICAYGPLDPSPLPEATTSRGFCANNSSASSRNRYIVPRIGLCAELFVVWAEFDGQQLACGIWYLSSGTMRTAAFGSGGAHRLGVAVSCWR